MMRSADAPRSSRRRTTPPPRAWARALLAWYRRHRRPLPWRGTRDPYRVWVSEVMLQQTQVATVRPYYAAFLRRFPTLGSLARAPLDEVLAAWSGLGYYRRARHLHQAVRLVVRDHRGRVPDDPGVFSRLPGVGRYTTGAVLSIAFDRPLPVLDANVARVLSRLFAVKAALRNPKGARKLWALAGSLLPMRGPGEWNQALMELGAIVCLPRSPRCGECPVRRWCRAYAAGRVEAYPPAVARREPLRLRRAAVLVERGGRVLMARRSGALLEGLWEPPGVDLRDGESARERLLAELRRLGVRARIEPTERAVRHAITHRVIEVEVWRGIGRGGAPSRITPLLWVDAASPRVAVTGLARKLLRLCGTWRSPARRGPRLSSSSR